MTFLRLRRELHGSNLENASVCSSSRFDNPREPLDCFSRGNQILIVTVYSAIEMLIYSWENCEALFPILPALGVSKYNRSVSRGSALLIVEQDMETENLEQGNAGKHLPLSLICYIESACKMRGSYSGSFNKRYGS